MKRLRSLFFWTHLVCGVVAGLVILMMCVTGVVLMYQRQMQYWADTRQYRTEPPAGGARASIERIVAAASARVPEGEPGLVTFRSDPRLPASVAMGTKTIYLNPYTAEVYGEPTGDGMRQFLTAMVNWHRYVAMSGESRPTGKAITGASNLAFLVIVLSGMYLWWPKSLTWAQIRHVTWFRGGLPGKARDFNWHNTIGFWSALPLAVVVYSGVVISYPWASNMVYRAVGEQPPPPAVGRAGGAGAAGAAGTARGAGAGNARSGGAGQQSAAAVTTSPAEPRPAVRVPDGVNPDRLFAHAMSYQADWNILSGRIPASATAPVTFTIDRGDGGQPQLRGTLTLDAQTGDVQKWEGFEAMSTGRQLRSFLRFSHTGEYFGLTGQTIAGLVSAGGGVLVYTGIALAFRRLLGWRARRRRVAAGVPSFASERSARASAD